MNDTRILKYVFTYILEHHVVKRSEEFQHIAHSSMSSPHKVVNEEEARTYMWVWVYTDTDLTHTHIAKRYTQRPHPFPTLSFRSPWHEQHYQSSWFWTVAHNLESNTFPHKLLHNLHQRHVLSHYPLRKHRVSSVFRPFAGCQLPIKTLASVSTAVHLQFLQSGASQAWQKKMSSTVA